MVIQLLQIVPEKYSVGFDDLVEALLRVLVLVDVSVNLLEDEQIQKVITCTMALPIP